jgi:hypothetical protein
MLSIGSIDKSILLEEENKWNQERDLILNYIDSPLHYYIVNQSNFFEIFFKKSEIIKCINKINNFCKFKTRKLLKERFVRIEPNLYKEDYGYDSASFAEINLLISNSENTLSELENNHSEPSLYYILRNDFFNTNNIQDNSFDTNIINGEYINKVSLSDVTNLLFGLNERNNILLDMDNFNYNQNRINPFEVSRVITRYQKYPRSYNRISEILTLLNNPNLNDYEIIRLNDELNNIVVNFDFVLHSKNFYRNISQEDSNIILPSKFLKGNINELTHAIAIGHLGLINFYKLKYNKNLTEHQDLFKWNSFHTAIANDELISFVCIIREFLPDSLFDVIHNNDDNDISIQYFLNEDEMVSEEIIQKLRLLKDFLENKNCGFFYSIFGWLPSNSKDFLNCYNAKKIKSFLDMLNKRLQINNIDTTI